jgi:hypothetical protein
MTDNVISLAKPKGKMPPGWRKHVEALKRTEADIEALRRRLKLEMTDFAKVMQEDMYGPGDIFGNLGNLGNLKPQEREVVERASRHLDKCARDALALLECASERVGQATPGDLDFELS